jgi:hypothetical protein
MADLYEDLKEFLNLKMTDKPPVEIIPAVDLYPKEMGFPLVGLMDGGDKINEGASQDLFKETVFITFYAQALGNYADAVLKVRGMSKEVRLLFQDPDNWAYLLPEWDNISYKGSNKLLTFEEEKDGNKEYIVFRTSMYEFSRGEEILGEI